MKRRSFPLDELDDEYWQNYRICPLRLGCMVACVLSAAIVFAAIVVAWRHVF